MVLSCVGSAANSASPRPIIVSSTSLPSLAVVSFSPIEHTKLLTPDLSLPLVTVTFKWPARHAFGARVARVAALESCVPIWFPRRHNLTLGSFSPVTSFQTGFHWFLHSLLFTGTSLSLWLTSLSEFSSFSGDFDRTHGCVLFTAAYTRVLLTLGVLNTRSLCSPYGRRVASVDDRCGRNTFSLD